MRVIVKQTENIFAAYAGEERKYFVEYVEVGRKCFCGKYAGVFLTKMNKKVIES